MKMVKPNLSGKVCLVTGASRGIGKGIAMQLAKAGALVYITGRTMESTTDSKGSLKQTAEELETAGGKCRAVQCDHSMDDQVTNLFETIKMEQAGRLDILVNNAFAAVNLITENLGKPYWKQPISMWDDVNRVGLRNHYLCTVLATRMMVEQGEGLIVNISSAAGLKYALNVPYGIGKAACDRMATDCSLEVKKHGVCVVSLWPGAVRTENITDLFSITPSSPQPPSSPSSSSPPPSSPALKSDGEKKVAEGRMDDKDSIVKEQKQKLKELYKLGSESAEFSGLGIAYLAADRKKMAKTGKVLLASDLASEYGFKDVDGSSPYSYRSVGTLLSYGGYKVGAYVPSWLKMPRWTLHLAGNKF